MKISSTSFQLNSSGKQQTKSLWHVWRSHSRSRPHICRLTVWKHRSKRGTEIASMFVIHTLEIQWGTEPEHGKLEEIPNMAIIPWCSMFHVDGVFFTSGRFSSHHPIFHPSTWYPPTLPFQHLWSWDPTSRAPTKWPLPRLASFESSSFWSSKIHQRARRGQGGRVIFCRFSQLKIWYGMIWYDMIWRYIK